MYDNILSNICTFCSICIIGLTVIMLVETVCTMIENIWNNQKKKSDE